MNVIHEWRKLKEAIAEKGTSITGKNGKRLSGGGCKSKDAALVEELMEWITQQSGANLDVLWKLIMFKAKYLHKEQVAEDAAEKVYLCLAEDGLWTIWSILDYSWNKKLLQFKRILST